MAIDTTKLPTPAEFEAAAEPLTMTLTRADGTTVAVAVVAPQTFKTGTYGWTGQIQATIGGLKVTGACQLFVSKSKEAPRTRPEAAAPATNGTGS